MAYTTIAKVHAVLPADVPIDETTHPTLAEAIVLMGNVEGELNVAFVSGGATLPVTDANTLAWADFLVASETAYRVLQARGAAEDKASLWQGYHESFTAAIERLSNPETAGATGAAAGVPRHSDTVEPWFTRDQVF